MCGCQMASAGANSRSWGCPVSDRVDLAGLLERALLPAQYTGVVDTGKVADAVIAAGWRNAVTEREIEHAQDEILSHCYDREDEATQGRAADAARAVARALGLVVEGEQHE